MIVVYATFEMDADSEGFEEWFAPLADQVRAEPGCDSFELWFDRVQRGRAAFVEVWRSSDDLRSHATHPAHVLMVDEGTRRWGWRNFDIRLWRRSDGHEAWSAASLIHG